MPEGPTSVAHRCAPARDSEARRAELRWDVAALLLLALCTAFFFRAVWGEDLTRVVPVTQPSDMEPEPGCPPDTGLSETDRHFVIWLVARNARTLLTRPAALYDAEPCFPAERSLALGEPGVNLGVLGIPAYLLTRDPVATYNGVLLALPLLSALAMYWVIKRWTGVPAAGIVAALLYAFHPLKAYETVHFYVFDTMWTVLALFFVQRLFARARWRDALGLCGATLMQLAGSPYPLLAGALIALPFLVWLVPQHGLRRQRPAQWIAIALMLACALAVLFGPYLTLMGEGTLRARPLQVFRTLTFLRPDRGGFPDWLTLGLLIAAFALPAARGFAALGRHARLTLAVGVLLMYAMSIGAIGGEFSAPVVWDDSSKLPPNLYMGLAQVIPGLGLLRAPGALFDCAVFLIAMLAGAGAAALLRSAPPRYATAAAALLLVLAAVEGLRLPFIPGIAPPFLFSASVVRPDDAVLDFYTGLAEKGNTGPLLQVPVTPRNPLRESMATLLSAYHHRRTGQCYNSYHTPEVRRVREVGGRLPERAAVEELGEMGFTTLVVSHPPGAPGMRARRRAYGALAAPPEAVLRRVDHSPAWSAYEIVPAGGSQSRGGAGG